MKAKPAGKQPKEKPPETISFLFTPAEGVLLGKIADSLFTTKAERRLVFLSLGRWCLANWNKVEPLFASEFRYAKAEGIRLFDLSQSKIALQSKLFGKGRKV